VTACVKHGMELKKGLKQDLATGKFGNHHVLLHSPVTLPPQGEMCWNWKIDYRYMALLLNITGMGRAQARAPEKQLWVSRVGSTSRKS
jgi:hypothetical protein